MFSLLIENLEWISLAVALFALGISCWFWKNPISTDFINDSIIEDDKGDVKYVVGHDHKGWKVKRLNYDENGDLRKNIKSWASKQNNPKIKESPQELPELDKLLYD